MFLETCVVDSAPPDGMSRPIDQVNPGFDAALAAPSPVAKTMQLSKFSQVKLWKRYDSSWSLVVVHGGCGRHEECGQSEKCGQNLRRKVTFVNLLHYISP